MENKSAVEKIFTQIKQKLKARESDQNNKKI